MSIERPLQPPLRSALFVPGNKLDWMLKAPKYGADALVFDLEDSVPASQKTEARQLIAQVIDELGQRRSPRLFVRLNALESGLIQEDLEAVVRPGLFAVALPKDQGPEDIVRLDALLGALEERAGLAVGSIVIRPLLESARAIRFAYEVAMASPRVGYIGIGTSGGSDFARAIGYRETAGRLETLYLRSKILLDARAAGVPWPMGGMWMKIHDLDGLRSLAHETRDLGYTGMISIYPGHIPIINEAFSPSPEEIAYWKGLVRAVDEAYAQGTAAVVYEGRMVDIAHQTFARQMLELEQARANPAPED